MEWYSSYCINCTKIVTIIIIILLKCIFCTTCCTRTCQKAVHSYKLYTHKINLTSQTFHTFLSVKNRLNFRIVYLEGLAT